ncbi:lipoprotein [Alphaproteobacteria bacterium]|nr:lipoprotein [Alphaproteobacteria bacterium]
MNVKLLLAGAVCAGVLGGAVEEAKADSLFGAAKQAIQAATLTDDDLRTLSEKSCAQMDQKSKVAPAGNAYAKRLVTILKGFPNSVDGQKLSFKVYLTKDVNAWAMPNGCVRVYSGLMDLMNDDEVRGVLGHEIGHVALGHSKKAMQVAYAASAAKSAAGSVGGSTVAALSNSQLGELGEKLVNSQFSQSQEMDSDNYSFDLLTSKKLSAKGLATAFRKLAQLDGGKSSMFSSHPSSAERAQNIERRLAAGK